MGLELFLETINRSCLSNLWWENVPNLCCFTTEGCFSVISVVQCWNIERACWGRLGTLADKQSEMYEGADLFRAFQRRYRIFKSVLSDTWQLMLD